MRSKYEILAEKQLKADGWIVDTKAGMARWAINRDFFHLFDILCIKPSGEKLHFISIKGHNSNQRGHRDAIRAFKLPLGCVKQLWRWPKRKKGNEGWIKEIL